MASASSHRYQSRLFSFIHKQSRILTNRLSRALKSLQSATSWITPIVFYPSLPQSASKQNLLQLPNSPLTVDTPIKQVLLLVETLPSQEPVTTAPSKNLLVFLWNKFFPKANTKLVTTANSSQLLEIRNNNTPNSLAQNSPKVQGIASLISNRLLVLVSPANEILDILTSQQQQVLEARIISEVTSWRLQRLLPSKPATTKQLPARHSWLLAPVKVISSIADWTQRDKQQGKLSIFPQDAIASLDLTIAKFETENLAPIASVTKGFQIQGLIWAAIDYFFGDRTSKLPQPTTNNLEDPWLTMSDLFGSEVAEQSLILDNPANSKIAYLPEDKNLTRSSQELNKYSLRNLFSRGRQLIQKDSASLSVQTPQITKILVKNQQQKPSSLISQNHNISQKLKAIVTLKSPSLNLGNSVAVKSSERLEHTPDWIETNATTMGYVKHPLEQLLEWLDLAMLWLENMLVKVWYWLQKR
ncbi:hypothetical protein [Synechocystis sp. PCC 7509]|uniref:hypothetical protein n=1 Tax=Synechocystis sp. PCC 7509 TaxID=927677 RepID=UPI0002ACBE0D|nr:hypothetical protein [Synechocystis sp. PCC 7509]